MLEIGRAPVVDPHRTLRRSGRIRDFDSKPLRREEVNEPPTHLAATAYHKGAPAGPGAAGSDAGQLLGRQRGADEQAQHVLGQRRRDTQLACDAPDIQNHVLLTLVVARRTSRGSLYSRHFGADRLPLGDQ